MRKVRLDFPAVARKYIESRVICRDYQANILRIAHAVGVFSNERLNQYLLKRSSEASSITVRNERTICLCVWRWGYDCGLLADAPRGIAKVKIRRKPTRAWTVSQLRQLLDATRSHDNKRLRSGAAVGPFLRAWIMLGYETGARFGDLMSFSRDHLDGDAIAWTQSKTGDPITRTLTQPCLDACHAMLSSSPDSRIIGWAARRRQAARIMRSHIDSVGIGGTSKWLRRSGATHCEMEKAGAGRLHLGHRSPALFEQSYCDWTQMRTRTPKTPALMEVSE